MSALALIVAGAWVVCQMTLGKALQRLGIA
jgi:hypothetical protein